MKITAVEPIHLRVPVVEPLPDGTLDVLIVKIHTDEGITGVGEVTSQSYVCKACFDAPRSAARRHGLTSILVGEDPSDPEALWEKMYYQTNRFGRRGAAIHAISGADIALWDIRGKIEGKPISQLLGGPLRSDVRAYASVLFGDTPDETARMASEYAQMGLTAVKFGWGPLGPDAEVDLAHVRAARQATWSSSCRGYTGIRAGLWGILALQLSGIYGDHICRFCICRFISVVLYLSLCICRFVSVVLYLSFCTSRLYLSFIFVRWRRRRRRGEVDS